MLLLNLKKEMFKLIYNFYNKSINLINSYLYIYLKTNVALAQTLENLESVEGEKSSFSK